MNHDQTFALLGNVDIYVIDQILKGRYHAGQSMLDAGCGHGRNLKWFYINDFRIKGVDADADRIAQARAAYPKASADFTVGKLDDLPYGESSFDHILCCAVLHFAQSERHFKTMLSEMVRVLKPSGTLLIRVASDIGLNGKKPFVQDGVNQKIGLFYLTRTMIKELLDTYPLILIEPIKTTNVQDERAMTTLVFERQ